MSSNKRADFREKVSKLMLREEESNKRQRIVGSSGSTSENTLNNNEIRGI
jgi:hypothetical protein